LPSSNFHWEGDLNEQRIQQIGPTIKRAMVAAAGRTAPQAEAWMKSNARWTDRTGNARNGLTARSVVSTNSVKVVLSHSVPYGIWLEVRWDGKYAIIEPAIQEWAPRMMELVARLAFTKVG
jgi:hypothetical protein